MDEAKIRPAVAAAWPTVLVAVCLLMIAGAALVADGAEVRGLYEAQVAVADREAGERRRALRQALAEVLVRVSGERAAARNPVVAEALREPDAYVQQFGYSTVEVRRSAGSLPVDALHLGASFDPGEVDRLLGDAGLPVWGRTRPSIVAWIAVERGGARELVGTEDTGGVAAPALAGARRRGVPLLLPLLDLEDRAALDAADVWAGSRGAIVAASERYEGDGVLAARAFQVLPTLWEVRWKLMLSGGDREWSTRGESLANALAGGVDEVADILASRYAGYALADSAAGLEVRVNGVDSLEQYARTLAYVGSLDVVTRIDVVRVEPGAVVLRIDARGGGATVRQVIGLGQVLAADEAATGLAFRLLR